MRLFYAKQHLKELLHEYDLPKDKKTAIRFALWCAANVKSDEEIEDKPQGVPYWRRIRFHSGMSSLFQCLNCEHKWLSVTPIGSYNGEGEYTAFQKYCPYCSIKFVSGIRSDYENPYMFSQKRLKQQVGHRMKSYFQWIIEQEKDGNWYIVAAYRDHSANALFIKSELDERREATGRPHRVRIERNY